MVATGQTDLVFADAPAAMQLRTKGAPVKIIAPVLQTNGFAIIALEDSGIASPKDLVGKKVAVQPGTAQTTLLDAILASNQIDKSKLDIINIDPGAFVGALLEKKVDAILGGADFHSVQIRERGFKCATSSIATSACRRWGFRLSPATTGSRPKPNSTGSSSRPACRAGTRPEEPGRGR